MLGLLKSGIKLGVGCFVTIVLLIALIAGAIYYYWIRKPDPKPRNGNRRAAILKSSGGSNDTFFQKVNGFFGSGGERQVSHILVRNDEVLAYTLNRARPALSEQD